MKQEYLDLQPQEDRSAEIGKTGLFVLGLQHAFTMFGATVLVPYLTGIPVNVALFTAGVGTLLFHWITKWKVPVFLGSSFAYIAPIIAVVSYYQSNGDPRNALAYAAGGLVIAGLVKFGIGILIKYIGIQKFTKLFPPVIAGTMIILIGLILSPTAVNMASQDWGLALVALAVAVIVRLYCKGFNRLIPVIWGIAAGYVVALISGKVDLSTIQNASWIGWPHFYLPKFSTYAISVIVPVAIVPAIEHFGDIFAISAVVGKPYYKDPGIHRTLMGDGLATSLAGLLGGPANTTYSENTGVLAFTKVFNPWVMRIAAIVAIALSLIPKIGAVVQSIPVPVMGGIELLLFGMIAAVGMRTLIQNQVHVEGKNLVIMSVMLVAGLGGAKINIGSFSLQGLGLAAVLGIALNIIFMIFKPSND